MLDLFLHWKTVQHKLATVAVKQRDPINTKSLNDKVNNTEIMTRPTFYSKQTAAKHPASLEDIN